VLYGVAETEGEVISSVAQASPASLFGNICVMIVRAVRSYPGLKIEGFVVRGVDTEADQHVISQSCRNIKICPLQEGRLEEEHSLDQIP
jgi:hypothetical protein